MILVNVKLHAFSFPVVWTYDVY